jgi:hypothetical protein
MTKLVALSTPPTHWLARDPSSFRLRRPGVPLTNYVPGIDGGNRGIPADDVVRRLPLRRRRWRRLVV